jgi:hypothetical protein
MTTIEDKKLKEDTVLECYYCKNDMNYPHYICCNGDKKCYWCWECTEVQHIDTTGKIKKGHNFNCDNKKLLSNNTFK